ncbi:MAG: Glu-tRNA(Gln) amidotransferase subunit GatE [Thermoplasmata archaeon]|nr:Glu-tRNA(Gln) amidotransferase subunit GatE [Thermoplasmata archaeon]
MDWKSIGLKVGLEIHQQLDTKKLFCDCSSELCEEVAGTFVRKLKAAEGESGEIDLAAKETAERNLVFRYEVIRGSTCLVECDEEPPHALNPEALKIVLSIAKHLNAEVLDEIHVMRKIVVDGSNTTGFQRTALVAVGGKLKVGEKEIGIPTLCLEEDAARKMEMEGQEVTYRLDRLGIPLIEIATTPDLHTPEEVREVAERIGLMLRATRKVKRGIGTIREDLNISVGGGARVEIKGVQELNLLPEYVKNEAMRQLKLVEVSKKLQERNAMVVDKLFDVTPVFAGSNSKVIKSALNSGGKVLAVKLIGFAGLLGKKWEEMHRLGSELAQHARVFGLGGIFHSDELPNYGITAEEVARIRELLALAENDAFVLAAGDGEKLERGLRAVMQRARVAIAGVPEETRDPLPDGTTRYSRPLPGGARMYPETDVPPIRVTPSLMADLIPIEEFEEKVARFSREYGISTEIAGQIIRDWRDLEFESLCAKFPAAISEIARVLTNTLGEMQGRGLDVEKLSQPVLEEIFCAYISGKFAKEGIEKVIEAFLLGAPTIEKAIEKSGVAKLSVEEVEKVVEELLAAHPEIKAKPNPEGALMGLAMAKLRGRADGKTVNDVVRKKLSGSPQV